MDASAIHGFGMSLVIMRFVAANDLLIGSRRVEQAACRRKNVCFVPCLLYAQLALFQGDQTGGGCTIIGQNIGTATHTQPMQFNRSEARVVERRYDGGGVGQRSDIWRNPALVSHVVGSGSRRKNTPGIHRHEATEYPGKDEAAKQQTCNVVPFHPVFPIWGPGSGFISSAEAPPPESNAQAAYCRNCRCEGKKDYGPRD